MPLRIRDRDAVTHQIDSLARGFGCLRVAAHERVVPLVAGDLLIAWDDVGSIDDALSSEQLIRLDDDSPALITATSGSTAAPKGVRRSFRRENPRSLKWWMGRTGEPEPRYLTYGPLSHAASSVALSALFEPWLEIHMLVPERFAREPGELFRIVGPHQITQLTGASSGFAAALRSIERRPVGVDLSSLREVTFGLEMIDPAVVERLYETGGRFGLDRLAVRTYYGLSEGGGTRTPAGQQVRIDDVDLEALVTLGVAQGPRDGALVKRVVSCGVEKECEVRIAGPDGTALPERRVGEVQFRGPGMMQGYEGPGAHEAFVDDGWMVTGDIGYIADGELFITGRIKEVMVQQGKKYHPEDIEWAAARGAEVAPDQCVAFVPLDTADGDGQVVLAIETERIDDTVALEQRVRATVRNTVGISVHTILFVPPASLPKASNGKSQRIAARDQYASGQLVPSAPSTSR
jgi:acyl-CoA synthetase (AMP-forming)/AMP-acid ligase II